MKENSKAINGPSAEKQTAVRLVSAPTQTQERMGGCGIRKHINNDRKDGPDDETRNS